MALRDNKEQEEDLRTRRSRDPVRDATGMDWVELPFLDNPRGISKDLFRVVFSDVGALVLDSELPQRRKGSPSILPLFRYLRSGDRERGFLYHLS